MDPLIGGAIGAVARLAPEVIKLLDRKNERKHELAVAAQQIEIIKVQGHMKLESDRVVADQSILTSGLEALKSAYESQKTGFKLADTISALVRPTVTYLVVGFWALVKIAAYTQLLGQGIEWDQAATTMWSEDDVAIFAGLLNFWFLSRVFEKRNGR